MAVYADELSRFDCEPTNDMFDKLNKSGVWWSMMAHYDSESQKITGYALTAKRQSTCVRFFSKTVGGCVIQALERIEDGKL